MIQDFMNEIYRMEMNNMERTTFLMTLIETEIGHKINKSTGITFLEYRFSI